MLFGAIGRDDLANIRIVAPEDELIAEFERMAGSSDSRLEVNELQNTALAALLPRLLSGEIRVKDAEREAERSL